MNHFKVAVRAYFEALGENPCTKQKGGDVTIPKFIKRQTSPLCSNFDKSTKEKVFFVG